MHNRGQDMSLMGLLDRLFSTANPRVREMARAPLFRCLPRRQLALLATHLDEVNVEAGKMLIREGCRNSTLWVLLEGEVEVLIGNTRQRTLLPGDFFGVSTMLDRRLALGTVKTRTPIRALVAGVAQFRAIKGNDTVATRLMLAAEDRLRENRELHGRPQTAA